MKQSGAGLLAGGLLLLAAAVSCSQQPGAQKMAEGAAGEIKGKPINPVVTATNAAAPALASVPLVVTNLAVSVTASNAVPEVVDGYLRVGFDRLASFTFVMPEDMAATNQPAPDQIPAPVKGLDQKPIALKGFMLPLKVEGGLVTELLVMRDQSMCCYGTVPKINEWVSVVMGPKGIKPVMDQPVTLFGKLHVGEMRENGYLVGIYKMDGDKMETAQ